MPAGTERAKKADGKIPKKNTLIKLAGKVEEPSGILEGLNADELVFALDVGTRTLVGVVGIQENEKFRIVCTETVEHKSRAMMDGQIHDIEQVAAVAKEVKTRLEARLGVTLDRVAIAAAGRVLKTAQVKVEKELEAGAEIDRETVSSLEIEGIQRAQAILDQDRSDPDGTRYYCVGYSVINYYLNGYVISKLNGHRGKTAGADILATFLPHMVVDSLYTVMSRIGLEVSSLTLEPIAAINVTIPPDLRLLNLALVDIGAGTSDIAITKDGSIIAYAMVPVAGDEITEKISQHYLVDFNTAEKIKIALSSSRETISYTDILRKKRSVGTSEVLELIRPAVEMLAENIADRILEYNKKQPNAIFLIGGGSRIPGLPAMIAGRLDLPADRVVVRGRDVIKDIKFSDKKLSGPESITPYGIAVTAQMQTGRDFMTVTVDGKKIKLFNSRKLSVADALVLVGFNPGFLIGRSGRGLSFTVNGELRTVRGEHGKPAEIYVNGASANLETIIRYGDDIRVVPAENGNDARVPVEDLLRTEGIDTESFQVLINGKTATPGYILNDRDAVEYGEIRPEMPEPAECPELADPPASQPKEDAIRQNTEQIPVEGMFDAAWVRVTVNGQEIVMKEDKKQYIFVDVFNYIDFDLSKPQGSIVLRLNGQQAAFTDNIRTGDEIEIYWRREVGKTGRQ